jgi:hypothetical protein
MKILIALFVSLLLTMSGLGGQAQASSYLINGSFETGTWGPWVYSGYGDGVYSGARIACATCAYSNLWSPQDGSHYVIEGPYAWTYLTQKFQDTPGELLTVSGWVLGTGTGGIVQFNFDGTTHVNINPVPSQNWTRYSFNTVATGNDTLQLAFLNVTYGDGLDNFSVDTAVSATPLPPSVWFFSAGLVLLVLFNRRGKLKPAG